MTKATGRGRGSNFINRTAHRYGRLLDGICKRCHHLGYVTCRSCGGRGGPGKGQRGVPDRGNRCALCLGTGTLACPVCGGVGVVPAEVVA